MKTKDRKLAEGILFTDQYQLTMAQLYFRMGLHERRARFEHYFRRYPDYGSHQAGYCVNAGLEWLVDWMGDSRFGARELSHLKRQRGAAGRPLFHDDFLAYLKGRGTLEAMTLRAVPEGRVVHPYTPLTVVEGPLAMAQVLETPLLNHLNYQTLIATKASRIREAARGQVLLEFGLRRAQHTGGSAGARAAVIGGADYSSNVGMSHVMGVPPKGTHAHSMVQVFMALGGGEREAFEAFADVYPDDCLLLVDTLNTLESGVPNAIKVFEKLRRKGHRPRGIRLDSGDLAHLAIQAAKMMDAAGFEDTLIVLSNELDELVVWQIVTQVEQEAPRYGVDADRLVKRLVFGVGTRLVTSEGCPSLGGVYKLAAVENAGGMEPVLKLSETREKAATPGEKALWRLYDGRGYATCDLIALVAENPRRQKTCVLHHPYDPSKVRTLDARHLSEMEPLHAEAVVDGRVVAEFPGLDVLRERREADLARLDPGVRRLVNPHVYHVSFSERLWRLKTSMAARAVGAATEG